MNNETEFPYEIRVDPSAMLHDVIKGKFSLLEQAVEYHDSQDTRILTLTQCNDSSLKIQLVEMDGSAEGAQPYAVSLEEKDCFTMSDSKRIRRRLVVLPDIVMEEHYQDRSIYWRSLGTGAKQDLFLLIEQAYIPPHDANQND